MEVYTDSTLIYTHRSHLQSKVHLPIYNSVVIGSKKCLIAFQYRVSFTSYELQVMCVVRLVQIWYNSSHLVQLIGVGTQQALVQIRNWLVVNIQQYLTVPVAAIVTIRHSCGTIAFSSQAIQNLGLSFFLGFVEGCTWFCDRLAIPLYWNSLWVWTV